MSKRFKLGSSSQVAFLFTTLASSIVLVNQTYAAMPDAGVTIRNTAYASYSTSDGGYFKDVPSNTVGVTITPLYVIGLTTPPLQEVDAGSKVIWLNELSNDSNAPVDVLFDQLGHSDLSNIKIYLDTNRDGKFDSSDQVISGPVHLEIGEKVNLWVVADTLTTLQDNTRVDLPVRAYTVQDNTADAEATDALISFVPQLIATKTVDKQQFEPVPGQSYDLKYNLEIKNNSSRTSGTTAIDVDGSSMNAVLLVDELPANTVFKSAKPANSNAVVLYKIANNKYTKNIPSDKNQINELVVAYPQALPGNATEAVELIVTMNSNIASTMLVNRFTVEHGTATGIKKTISNDAITNVGGHSDVSNNSGDYSITVGSGTVKKPLYISANGAMCNAERNTLDKVNIKVQSTTTGDIENVQGIETGLNTGVFRFELPTQESLTANPGDMILQTVKRDKVIVSLTDCLDANGTSTKKITDVNTDVLIDPYGIVFDAKTGLPVAGATVTLRDANGQPVGPNVAFKVDEITGALIPIDAVQVTDSDGQFVYPLVEPGTYSLHVDTTTIPGGITYTFTSDRTIYNDFGTRPVDINWSYGGNFSLKAGDAALNIDIPIDPSASTAVNNNLTVKKEINGSKNAEIGDFKDYTVTVANQGNTTLYDVDMKDTLPRGLVYVSGTMRVDGKKVADPQGGKGPYLTLGLGTLTPKQEAKVQYRVYVGPNALSGDGINRAHARDQTGTVSNEAQAKLKITPGVFSPDGFVVGKVFADCNRNGVQDKGEAGIPGVRIYMEDGTFVVTDREGKYNFYGIKPITHVLKVDTTTLPANSEMLLINNRQAGDPGSRFVDIKRGELHRADFAIADGMGQCSDALAGQIEERKKNIDAQLDALEQVLRADLSIDPSVTYVSDVQGQPSSGCISAVGASANCNIEYKKDQIKDVKTVHIEPVKAPVSLDLEQELQRSESNQLSILNLRDQQILPAAQTMVQLKGALGTDIQLFVNDEQVSEKRIGKKAAAADLGVAGFDFIGVALKPGKNKIEARQLDSWGNLRDSRTVTVIAPGNMNQLSTQVVEQQAYANGKDVFQVVVKIQDQNGTPVAARTPLTIESSIGTVQLTDLEKDKPGTQIFVEGGSVVIPVLAPTEAGEGVLRISSGIYERSIPVRFLAELRPMLVTGIIEGSFALNDFDPKELAKTSTQDGFEEELTDLSVSSDGTKATRGRAAFFLKGKVRGDYLLTMAYDSAKDNNQRLFRDIRPDEYYPVYGDASAKGFDAQSTSKLYVRVDKGRSYAMYGDYVTRTENDEGLSLGQYSRSLTGLKSTVEGDRYKVSGFASRTSTTQMINELRAMGVSGPYSLGINADDIQENSEKVEIIVRDRNNPGLIISQKTLSRFSDYEIDTYSNSIYLTTPLSSIDENLNPVYLRITVETDQGGDEYTVAGVNGSLKLTEQVSVGGSYIQNEDPVDEEKIASVNTVVKLNEKTKLIAEYAYSEYDSISLDNLTKVNASSDTVGPQDGSAARVELDYKNQNVELRAYHHQADTGFKNASSSISAGRKESAVKLNARVDKLGVVRLETIRTEDTENNGVRNGVSATIERAITRILTAEIGVRYYEESVDAASQSTSGISTPYNGTTVRTKLKANLPFNGTSIFAEYEQDISDSERQVFALGGDTNIYKNVHAYARHEFISSIGGLYELNDTQSRNTTVFGLDSQYMRDGSVFSEYRVRDGLSAREAEAAMGVRNRWQLKEGLFFNTSFEKVKVMEGENKDSLESTAATVGFEHLSNPRWKNVARVEGRWSSQSDSYLNTLGTAYKLTDEVTLLAKNVLNFTDNKSADSGDRLVNRFQLGAAYRDVETNRFDALSKIEHRYEDNQSTLTDPHKRNVYLFSTHMNYHPSRAVHLSGQYAVKYLDETYDMIQTSGMTQMLNGRFMYDINERWDAGVNSGVMWNDVSDGIRYMAGVEVGYLLASNLWLSGGYNFTGYDDKDLTDGDTTMRGAYFRFRFKFDENLFNRNKASVNKALEPK
ncbi:MULTISPECIES: SdrD B-like domain-containing protein [Acinetobacter]|uniref:SdrD B-like domain-containing protein n=1 Tax=Acinetobacter TaxID=469 RepID=UPI001D180E17|nr:MULTISPECIES: SdrD B-like domain-containing protein [Acinetobacter]WOE40636.1 SdrD B-like domain-containing protein [Acinetobacter chinensis]